MALGAGLFLMSEAPLHVNSCSPRNSFLSVSEKIYSGTVFVCHPCTLPKGVEIESIRKMLARVADTGHSNKHNAWGSTSFWMCKVRCWCWFGNKIPISVIYQYPASITLEAKHRTAKGGGSGADMFAFHVGSASFE